MSVAIWKWSFMKLIENVGFKKLALAWPFYATWNMAAFTLGQRGWKARCDVLLLAIPFLIFSIGAWTSFWLTVGWVLVRLAKVTVGAPT